MTRESSRGFGVLVLAVPSAVWLLLPSLGFGLSLYDYVPGFDNDEIHYWHEILSFSHVGFSSGYYTVDELTARAAFSPFGPEGPAFAFLVGSIAKLSGWYLFSPAYFNALLVFLSLTTTYFLGRPPLTSVLLITALIATYWPLALVAPTIMQEPLHHVAAIVLAGAFYRLIASPHSSVSARWMGGAMIAAMSAIRCTWSAFSVPFLFLTSAKSRLGLLLASVAFASLAVVLAFWWSAPYPRYRLWHDLMSGDRWVREWLLWNASNFFRFVDEPYGSEAAWLGLLLRCQIAGVAIYAGWRMFLAVRDRDRIERAAMALILFTLLHIILAQVLFYSVDNFHDYRVFGPYLLFALMLLALFHRFRIATVVIASNLLVAPVFLEAYALRNIEGVDYVRRGAASKNDPIDVEAFGSAVRDTLVYTPDPNRWCNTLLTRSYRSVLVAVPAGIGLTMLLDIGELRLPPMSKYLLLPDSDPLLASAELRLERLSDTSEGTLYYNLDSTCPR